MAEVRHTHMDYDDGGDPFANFSYGPVNPPRPIGRLRSFTRHSRYKSLVSLSASRERLPMAGSFTNLGSLSGSMQNLLDPTKMMSMQEDAKSRRISSEVMKHRLYESVLTSPRRRRFSMRSDYNSYPSDEQDYQSFNDAARYAQSLPVTPAHSQNVTPAQSPTSHRRYHWGYWPSRGHTPSTEGPPEMVEEEECPPEDAWKGLASLFRPHPRCISAHQSPRAEENQEEDMDTSLMPPPPKVPPIRQRRHRPQPHGFHTPQGGGNNLSNDSQNPFTVSSNDM